MMFSRCIHLNLLIAALSSSAVAGFVVPTSSSLSSSSSSASLSSRTLLRDSLRETGNMEDFEGARQAFERLALDTSTGTLKPGPLPMTANVERLRRMELKLLETLGDSDQAIDPLVELWVKERRNAAEALFHMINSQHHDLEAEETMLREMMDDYGEDGWVEPHGRLAVILFMKGEYMEVLDLCDYVLYHKPWHFEVAQLMGVTFLRLGDFRTCLKVTRECVLPPLRHPKRRKQWLDRMTRTAQERLAYASTISTKEVTVDVSAVTDESCWQ